MIKSMTGYGVAEGRLDNVTYAVEIRTVNSKYFKARVKVPEQLTFLEDEVEKLLAKNLGRGSVNYTLSLRDVSENLPVDFDAGAMNRYLGKLESLLGETKFSAAVDIGALLALPGVMVSAAVDDETAEKVRKHVSRVSLDALGKVDKMRLDEGNALAADLMSQLDAIREQLKIVQQRCPVVTKEYHDKLAKRVNALLSEGRLEIDEEILAREVAIFAERSDVSEEITRLDSHLGQFAQICRDSGQAGRKLDFLSQEMLREANTIGSKSADIEIARAVVDIKCCIDRIKEQVQNVE